MATEPGVGAARDEIRAATAAAAEGLAAAARRIRRGGDNAAIAQALLEEAACYCGRAALLAIEDGVLSAWGAIGYSAALGERHFRLPAREDAAVTQAVERREPVVAGELSGALAALLGPPPGQPVWLFPLARRGRVEAVLYADAGGSGEPVQPAALELLCLAAEAAVEARATPRRPAEEAVIRVARAGTPPRVDPALLPAAEREAHLREQRYARILVADLMLARPFQIREGRREANLYGRLREEIDRSRESYRRKFANAVAAGVDSFHEELVRTLALGNEALLGPEYPGPQI